MSNIDRELVSLYVDEYRDEAAGLIPDLEDSLLGCDTPDGPSGSDMRDALEDTMADRICDGEMQRGTEYCDEFRAAGKAIAEYFF